jgi:multidrug transporter EmrE-like cation transporter
VATFLLAVFSVVLSVAAQFTFKAGLGSTNASLAAKLMHPAILGGFLLYGMSAVIWLSVLTRWEVSKAYPMVGMGFALSAAVGLSMGESVSATRWVGIGLICAGVYLVGRT